VTLTPLEHEILERYHGAYAAIGFPPPGEINVTQRENSGAGRFVTLTSSATVADDSRTLDLPPGQPDMIAMEGVAKGLGFVVFLKDGQLDFLELYTFVGDWDGEERPWKLGVSSSQPGAPNA
jgi:hypothetical protein